MLPATHFVLSLTDLLNVHENFTCLISSRLNSLGKTWKMDINHLGKSWKMHMKRSSRIMENYYHRDCALWTTHKKS